MQLFKSKIPRVTFSTMILEPWIVVENSTTNTGKKKNMI
jgi:hypothetical protein